MNWKVYQSLTLKQQNEWNFRFKDKLNNIPTVSIIWLVIIWINMVTVATIFLGKVNGIITIKDFDLYNMYYYNLKLSYIIMLAFIIFFIIDWIIYMYWCFCECKWLNEVKKYGCYKNKC